MKEAIQSNNGDLSEAECARISAEAEEAGEERVKENQQGSGKGKRTSKHPKDDVMATLHQQLQETGRQLLQLQQAMRPQTPAEVFMAYVKGPLVNLTQRKFKKGRKDISRIVEVVMQDSDEEEHARAAPPSSWQEPIDPFLHPPSRLLRSPSSSGSRPPSCGRAQGHQLGPRGNPRTAVTWNDMKPT